MTCQAEVFVRRLTGEEGQRLVRSAHTSQDQVPRRRAMILLASAQGRSAEDIAGLLEGSVDYVREVIHAFNAHGFETLNWARKGVGTAPRTPADTIAGALAASPWPAPVKWARPAPGSPRSDRRSEPPRRSSPAVRSSNGRHAPADTPTPAALTSDERERLHELERENARLRQERELLKAAAAFFAAECRKT